MGAFKNSVPARTLLQGMVDGNFGPEADEKCRSHFIARQWEQDCFHKMHEANALGLRDLVHVLPFGELQSNSEWVDEGTDWLRKPTEFAINPKAREYYPQAPIMPGRVSLTPGSGLRVLRSS